MELENVRVYERLHFIGERNRVAYFTVTKIEKNPTTLYEIPVVEIASLSEEFKEQALVIPAVQERFLEEVIQNIQKHGFCHYTEDQIFFEEIKDD